MTDINFFEYAINQHETNDFFRGRDRYFIPSPDYEGHVHGANMGGSINTFVLGSPDNAEKFDKAFLEFLQDLTISAEDVNHLLANLSSYFAQKSRGNLEKTHLFTDPKSQEYGILRNYISKIFKSDIYIDVKEQLARHAKFIENKGNNLVANCLRAEFMHSE